MPRFRALDISVGPTQSSKSTPATFYPTEQFGSIAVKPMGYILLKSTLPGIPAGIVTSAAAATTWLLSVLAPVSAAATLPRSSVLTFCGCQAEQPKYSAAELQAGLDKAIDTAPLSAEEKARLHAGASAKNGQGGKNVLGSNDGGPIIIINTPVLRGCAPPGSPAAVDAIAAICRHEIFHINPPSSGGCGPAAGGVTSGVPDEVSMCTHIGLQYWGAMQTCADAAAAAAAGNAAAADALCELFRGQLGTMQPGGQYSTDAYHCRGWLQHPDESSVGPPPQGAWGFPYPARLGCEACLNHGGTGGY